MATTTGSITYTREFSTLETRNCAVSRSMLLSAFSENVAITLDVGLRSILGAAAAWIIALVLPTPDMMFFAALSAALPVIYLANLGDVRNVRDAIVCIVPALMVWGILFYDVHNTSLLGLTLFTHVMVAFFAGFSRVSGSLSNMRLWPVLFGFMSVSLIAFIELFTI